MIGFPRVNLDPSTLPQIARFSIGALLLTTCLSGSLSAERHHVVRKAYLMGTEAQLEIYSTDRIRGLEQLEEFLGIIEKTEAELSTWNDNSTIARINAAPQGTDFPLQADLCRLFADITMLHRVSNGSFDPAIGRLIAAWDMHSAAKFLTSTGPDMAKDQYGLPLLGFSSEQCMITKRGNIHLDTGAFGKGEALDRIGIYSKQVNSDPWLINFGGQVAVHGLPPDCDNWQIDLSSPVDRHYAYMTVHISKGSMATSGNSERIRSVNGVRVGHILDPGTGRPSMFAGSVTVWHPDALYADALSTALHVMGPEKGIEWANLHEIAVCFIDLSGSGQIQMRRNCFFDPLVSH